MLERKKVIFLTSSYVNLAKNFAEDYKEYDIFLIQDRKFPFEYEDLDNFYTYTYANEKLFEKNKEKYFDNLAVFIEEFSPELIITNNFTKLLPKSFIEFLKFRLPNLKIINLHNADLRKGEKYIGIKADMYEFLEDQEITTTIHLIEDEKMDEGKQLAYSFPTTIKELKIKKLVNNRKDILNLRIRNVVLSYHQRTKVLKLLYKSISDLLNNI